MKLTAETVYVSPKKTTFNTLHLLPYHVESSGMLLQYDAFPKANETSVLVSFLHGHLQLSIQKNYFLLKLR